jgi:hypothetical protein
VRGSFSHRLLSLKITLTLSLSLAKGEATRAEPLSLPAERPAEARPRAEIFLVLIETESYHWSPSLRVGTVVHANTRCHRGRCPHYR